MGRQKHDRKNIKRAQALAKQRFLEQPTTYEHAAMSLVARGLASPLILERPMRGPHGGGRK